MTADWDSLLPLLVHIQAHLEGDIGLAALSRKAGLSPFQLQRRFKAAIGETPKAYTSRSPGARRLPPAGPRLDHARHRPGVRTRPGAKEQGRNIAGLTQEFRAARCVERTYNSRIVQLGSSDLAAFVGRAKPQRSGAKEPLRSDVETSDRCFSKSLFGRTAPNRKLRVRRARAAAQ